MTENGRCGLVIGAENRTSGTGLLEESVQPAGAKTARIVVVTTATQVPETVRMLAHLLGYDRADVAVVTNIADGTAAFQDLIQVESLVAEEIRAGGHLVLGADDPNAVALADRPAVRDRDPVPRYFAMSAANPVVERHLRRGGVAYVVADGWLVEAAADRTTWLLPAAAVAGSFGGRADFVIANALAATAAVRALGAPPRAVAQGLRTLGASPA